jgi:nitric oxide reductase NorD protein
MTPLTSDEIQKSLERWLEVEFTLKDVGSHTRKIAALTRPEQDFVLLWTQRLSAAHVQMAYLFVDQAPMVLQRMEMHLIEIWLTEALDAIDKDGLKAAVDLLRGADRFTEMHHVYADGVVLEEVRGVLLTFARGLSGRRLQLEASDCQNAWTDGETLFVPEVVAQLPSASDNFVLCKALVAILWAQAHFGTLRLLLENPFSSYDDPDSALACFNMLETLRLEAHIERELPGLGRQMRQLESASLPQPWQDFKSRLSQPDTQSRDSLNLLPEAMKHELPKPRCYQCELHADVVRVRIEKEKVLLRVKLSELVEELPAIEETEFDKPVQFGIRQEKSAGMEAMELILDDVPMTPPDDIRQLLSSVMLDFGEIPPEYLVAAGPGEYDPALWSEQKSPDEVWQGTYHEEGAILYPEWDFRRGSYRKNWCVMREIDVQPLAGDFVSATLEKYGALLRQIRRTFEGMRDEDRLLKRQSSGEHVDMDALIEALADLESGAEMSELLYARLHRAERNIAVTFLVDMSGSTKGWVNDAERESLVLMSEALEALGDRYAIYGFSGMTRKRCELFRIKRFKDAYDDTVKSRISGIRPQDYTRMGFAVRHMTRLLREVEARSRLLIILSDGRPEDYHDGYRGEYGIEDTRQALIEARRSGIHPFCITIDTEGRDYLKRLYGPAHFVVIDSARELPLRVAEIYRKLTV